MWETRGGGWGDEGGGVVGASHPRPPAPGFVSRSAEARPRSAPARLAGERVCRSAWLPSRRPAVALLGGLRAAAYQARGPVRFARHRLGCLGPGHTPGTPMLVLCPPVSVDLLRGRRPVEPAGCSAPRRLIQILAIPDRRLAGFRDREGMLAVCELRGLHALGFI